MQPSQRAGRVFPGVRPDDADAQPANCYARLGDAAKARALAGEAEALASKDASVFLLSAQAYEQIGDRTQALSKVAAALEGGRRPVLSERLILRGSG